MDLWRWYRRYRDDLTQAGLHYPVKLMDNFVDSVVEMEYDKLDAMLPEVRALRKSAQNPWLEVFSGHWEMRHRLANAGEGQTALSDTVALFERAQREDTAGCPQSVCVTQDLSHCYGNVDAPGWADERIAVCQETLQKITPRWNCFQCLSEEQFLAMSSKGQYADALAFVRRQIAAMQAAGVKDVDGLREDEAVGLMQLGQYDEALAVIDAVIARSTKEDGAQCLETQAMIRLRVLARMGRDEEAWRALPAITTPHNAMAFTEAISYLLARAPEQNRWQVGATLQHILKQRAQVGAHRDVITVAKTHIALALARQAIGVARRALAVAQRHLSQLRQPLGEDVALAALAAQIEASAGEARLPVAAAELLDWLGQRNDSVRSPEQEAEWLLLAAAERPDDQPLLLMAAHALTTCAAQAEAIDLLEGWRQRHPQEESDIVLQLLAYWLDAKNFERIRQVAEHYHQVIPHVGLWFDIQAAVAREQWELAEQLSLQLAAIPGREDKIMPWHIASRSALKCKKFAAALSHAQQSIARQDALQQPADTALWVALIAASALQQWPDVRHYSARLEIPLTGDSGPVEEDWGWIRLRCWEDNQFTYSLAQRTGPVSARVLQPSHPEAQQHHQDRVIFMPEMLNQQPESEEEQADFIGMFDCLHVVEPGQYAPSLFIDGFRPDGSTYSHFVEQLEAHQCHIWVTSDDDYQIFDTQTDTLLPGIHFLLAAPLSMDAKTLDRLLLSLTADWPHPLQWLGLAQQAGLDEHRHEDIMQRYEL